MIPLLISLLISCDLIVNCESVGKLTSVLNTCSRISEALVTGADVSVIGFSCAPLCRKPVPFWDIQGR